MLYYFLMITLFTPFAYIVCKDYFNEKYLIIRSYIIRKIVSYISQEKDRTKSFFLNKGGKTATIKYFKLGKEYNLIVPYDRRLSTKHRHYKVKAIMPDGNAIDITQQSGIPYFISGGLLNAEKVIVYKGEKQEKVLDNDQIISLD